MENQSKRVVVLGAGYVCAPVVEYLHREKSLQVTIASALKDEADAVANQYSNVTPVLLDVLERPDTLQELVSSADVVVSLLPHSLHHIVAECCIDKGVNMVTASYCTPRMRELSERAVDANVTIVNEVGLDPGIDHLLAMECIDEVHQGGGKVESFVSYCGGLPAPEYSDNSLRYKFSWSPRAVLLNTLSSARYISDGQTVEIAEGGELMSEVNRLNFLPGFSLEGFPNRDSSIYARLYGITEARTILRGTLRFQGFSDTIKGMLRLGLIDPDPHPILHPRGPEITWVHMEHLLRGIEWQGGIQLGENEVISLAYANDLALMADCAICNLTSWNFKIGARQVICSFLGITDSTIFYENLKSKLRDRIGGNGNERVDALESLGLLKEDPVLKLNTPLDTLSHFLSKKLALERTERDLVILRHDVGILWPDGRREKRGINLVMYGDPGGHSAMSQAVGFPTAIATKMILDGEIQQKGMVLPFTPDIYRPMLSRLRAEGLKAVESSTFL